MQMRPQIEASGDPAGEDNAKANSKRGPSPKAKTEANGQMKKQQDVDIHSSSMYLKRRKIRTTLCDNDQQIDQYCNKISLMSNLT